MRSDQNTKVLLSSHQDHSFLSAVHPGEPSFARERRLCPVFINSSLPTTSRGLEVAYGNPHRVQHRFSQHHAESHRLLLTGTAGRVTLGDSSCLLVCPKGIMGKGPLSCPSSATITFVTGQLTPPMVRGQDLQKNIRMGHERRLGEALLPRNEKGTPVTAKMLYF